MSCAPPESHASDSTAARERLGHRIRPAAILDVEGMDRALFLHGQVTQEVQGMAPGQARPAAGLTPKGKLLYIAQLLALPDRFRLLLSASSRVRVRDHLKKYAVFQRVDIVDRSDELVRIGLYGPETSTLGPPPGNALLLTGEGEFSAEVVVERSELPALDDWLRAAGSVSVAQETAEALRVEAGRPRYAQDADESRLADEVGLAEAISTTKGCYVGQEVVARIRTYGHVQRRLVGFRFPRGSIPAGALLRRMEEPEPGKIEQGRVTSSVRSPVFGPIGLGYAAREIEAGDVLISAEDPTRCAVVAHLPFA